MGVSSLVEVSGGAPAVAFVLPGGESCEGWVGQYAADAFLEVFVRDGPFLMGIICWRGAFRVDGCTGADGEEVDLVPQLDVPVEVDLAFRHGFQVHVCDGLTNEAMNQGCDVVFAHALGCVLGRQLDGVADEGLKMWLKFVKLCPNLSPMSCKLVPHMMKKLVAGDNNLLKLISLQQLLDQPGEALIKFTT